MKEPRLSTVNVGRFEPLYIRMLADCDRLSPDTLDAYIEKFSSLIPYLSDTVPAAPPSDPAPPNQESSYISLQVNDPNFCISMTLL